MYYEKSQKVQSPFYVSLFHEIGHSWLNQITSRSELSKIWVDGSGNNLSGDIKQSEIAASYIENLLRSEQGLPIRTSYSPDADKASTLIDFNSIKWSPSIRGNTLEILKLMSIQKYLQCQIVCKLYIIKL